MTPQENGASVTTPTDVNQTQKTHYTSTSTKMRLKPTPQLGNDSVAVKTPRTTNKTANDIQIISPKHLNLDDDRKDNDNRFLDRVLAVMKSSQPKNNVSKPPISPASLKSNNNLPNGVNSNKSMLNGGRPPPHPPSYTSKSKNEMLTHVHKVVPEAALKTTNTSSHNPSVNGYADDISLTTSIKGNKYINIINGNDLVDETPVVAVTLTIPFSTTDKMSASTSSKYNVTSTTATTSAADRRINSYLLNRSPSPSSSARSTSSRCSSISSNITSSSARSSNTYTRYSPRRVFPQTYTRTSGSMDMHELNKLESSPVVFDANMSFVLGCQRQPVHQTLRPSPSYMDDRTSSAYLSEKIQNFLRRTDHVQEEWSAMGRRSRRYGSLNSRDTTPTNSLYDDYDTISLIERQRERKSMERSASVGRSRSAQNILTKAFQLTKQLPSTPTSRSNSMARDLSEDRDDRTIHEEDDDLDFDEVNIYSPPRVYVTRFL